MLNIKYNRTLIFDGSYALHRCLCSPELFAMHTSTGIGTGGILGVLRTILKEMKTYNYFPIVVFDGGLSPDRLEIYPNYKRALDKQKLNECLEEEKTEAQIADENFMKEYRTQRNILIELLPLLGIPCIRIEDWEGDDLLYVISQMSLNSIVVSDDKDLIQLIASSELGSNRTCRIRRALNDQFWDYNSLKDLDIDDIETYIRRKAIIGDPSDNMASACEGVGDKTALGLVKILNETLYKGCYFPQDEKELEKICKKLDISKRKAYLNFNYDQYKINYLLTNLNFVDDFLTKDVILIIEDKINNSQIASDELRKEYLEKAKEIFKQLEIFSFQPIQITDQVDRVKSLLYIENKEQTSNINEINLPSGKLF